MLLVVGSMEGISLQVDMANIDDCSTCPSELGMRRQSRLNRERIYRKQQTDFQYSLSRTPLFSFTRFQSCCYNCKRVDLY
ncbi:hypothetical protein LOK49_LG03G01827 [Camellia lanceoleosa]|uniref:Uncharacterized protein n=1 Tax=Camellia lanceoleosa TaxID=1840588 RepID=A0ACC0IA10_9ERIC|nr:hypothetical protein LOK49_LG03G01827 [Camellia lanceoleosa]